MKANRTVRYRLYPGRKSRHNLMMGTIGAGRKFWNNEIARLQKQYKETGKCDFRFFSLCKEFTKYRNRKSNDWMSKYGCNVVRDSLKPIEIAYKEFFKDIKKGSPLNRKPPDFKAKHFAVKSFPIDCYSCKMSGKWIRVQKIGWMKISGNNRYTEGKFKSGRIKYECGKWYAYISYEVDVEENTNTKAVGIDRNASKGRSIVRSDGIKYGVPDLAKEEAEIKKCQREVNKYKKDVKNSKVPGSCRHRKAKIKLQKANAAKRHKIQNWCHQKSRETADEFGTVYMEDLNIAGMTKSAKGTVENPGKNVKAKSGLNRVILANGWGLFDQCIGYKAKVIKVDPKYTSQKCSECGHVEKENRVSQSKFKCRLCGFEKDADVNAALNIYISGAEMNRRGDSREMLSALAASLSAK